LPDDSERGSTPRETGDSRPDTLVDQRHGSRRSSTRHLGRDLTQGSIPRNLMWLAWPQVVESVLNVVDQIADLIWAGIISAGTIAGVGIAQSYKQLVMTARMGLDTAMRAMISRAVGAGDMRLANHAALQGFTVSAGFSIVMVVTGVFMTVPLMRLLGVGDEVIDTAATYLRIQFVGTGTMAFRQTSGAALQAAGDAITPMKATLLTRSAHLALTPFLIFGWLWFPDMGIAGAALADVLAQGLGAFWNFSVLFRGNSRLQLTLHGYYPDFRMMRRLVRIGLPASVTGMERSIAQLVVVGLVAQFGTLSLAAFSLTRRAENLAHLGSGGLGRASGVLVGQNLGAGRPERAKQTVVWAQVYVVSISLVLTALLIIFAPVFVKVFTRDPTLVDLASTWMQIQAISFIFLGAGMVFAQSFNMAGDTIAPMLVTLFAIWGIQLPLALMLTGTPHVVSFLGVSGTFPVLAHLGEFGVAWAIVISMAIRAVSYVPYYYWGRWLRVRMI
jgi:putative MATE family efflux protein